jgi:hypothetical protein
MIGSFALSLKVDASRRSVPYEQHRTRTELAPMAEGEGELRFDEDGAVYEKSAFLEFYG